MSTTHCYRLLSRDSGRDHDGGTSALARRSLQRSVVLLLILVFGGLSSNGTTAVDAASVLAQARNALGFQRADGRILHYRASATAEQNYQSDRFYPPFFSAMLQQEVWFDVGNNVVRVEAQTLFPGAALSSAAITIDDGKNAVTVRGERTTPIARRPAAAIRNLNPWAVLADWSSASDVRIAGTERYREYPRLVLERHTSNGVERLFVDAKSGFPVKLDLVEPHYLWGQRHIEYLWSTWTLHDGIALPGAAFRLADGAIETSATFGKAEWVGRDSTAALPIPPAPAEPPSDTPQFLQPAVPTTVKVTANTWLLVNPGYTEAVTRVGNDVYVFDATQGESRAALDAEAIAGLFPGHHRITVIVTDLAWPHIAGVRYWVSQGAKIVAHAAARSFLQQVVDRRWTVVPDALEKSRARNGTAAMTFVPIQQLVTFGEGAVRVAPIDGIGSELALMVYVAADRFLWASDYIQTLAEPTLYAREVIQSVHRVGFRPQHVAAQHLPLTDWHDVLAAQGQ